VHIKTSFRAPAYNRLSLVSHPLPLEFSLFFPGFNIRHTNHKLIDLAFFHLVRVIRLVPINLCPGLGPEDHESVYRQEGVCIQLPL
jgi:hypothetical protein